MTLDVGIERLYDLNVGTTAVVDGSPPHERPHKPLLLLAALDLIDEGLAAPVTACSRSATGAGQTERFGSTSPAEPVSAATRTGGRRSKGSRIALR